MVYCTLSSRLFHVSICVVLYLIPYHNLLHAELIEATRSSTNDAFYDTSTGLIWMDPANTRGREGISYNEMLVILARPGWEGWRYATKGEFEELMVSAKIPAGNSVSAYSNGLHFFDVAGGTLNYAGNSRCSNFRWQEENIFIQTGTERVSGSRYIFKVTNYDSACVGGSGYGLYNSLGAPSDDKRRFFLGHALVYDPVVDVEIDVKPGSDTNPINLKSNGKTPVAILSSVDFDATLVDESTVQFNSANVAYRRSGKYMASVEDVNGDELPDLVCHFPTQDIDQELLLMGIGFITGKTFGGTSIEGFDVVEVVP